MGVEARRAEKARSNEISLGSDFFCCFFLGTRLKLSQWELQGSVSFSLTKSKFFEEVEGGRREREFRRVAGNLEASASSGARSLGLSSQKIWHDPKVYRRSEDWIYEQIFVLRRTERNLNLIKRRRSEGKKSALFELPCLLPSLLSL